MYSFLAIASLMLGLGILLGHLFTIHQQTRLINRAMTEFTNRCKSESREWEMYQQARKDYSSALMYSGHEGYVSAIHGRDEESRQRNIQLDREVDIARKRVNDIVLSWIRRHWKCDILELNHTLMRPSRISFEVFTLIDVEEHMGGMSPLTAHNIMELLDRS